MKTPGTLFITLLVSLAIGFAQDPKPPVLASEAWNEETDFAVIRFSYAAAPGYNAYLTQVVEMALITEAMQEWDSGRMVEALDKLRKATEDLPLSIEAYRRLADGFAVFIQAAKDPETKKKLEQIERRYRVIAEGLLKSIVASGDGKTPQTAYKVISIPEEYMTLWFLGLTVVGQRVEELDGRTFDLLRVLDSKASVESEVYFDISAFAKQEANHRSKQTATSDAASP